MEGESDNNLRGMLQCWKKKMWQYFQKKKKVWKYLTKKKIVAIYCEETHNISRKLWEYFKQKVVTLQEKKTSWYSEKNAAILQEKNIMEFPEESFNILTTEKTNKKILEERKFIIITGESCNI